MLLIASTLVIAIGLLSYQNGSRRSAANEQAQISARILEKSHALLSALKDAETGQRGYLLIGDPNYLQPYQSALAALPTILKDLEADVVSRPDQAERLKQLNPLIQAMMSELDQTIATRRTQGLAPALSLVAAGTGKARMDDIRSRSREIAEIAQARAGLFASRAESSAARLRVVSTFGSLLLLGFLCLSAITIFRGMARRDDLYQQAFANASTLRVTLGSIGDAVVATNRAGVVTFINPVAEKLTGWAERDAVGQPISRIFNIVNETTRAAVPNPIAKALELGTIVGLANHTVLIARDGSETPIDDSAAPIRDEKNQVIGAIIVFRDITERRRAERQLKLSNEQLSQFVSAAAHDLKSPLNSVNAMAELLKRRYRENLGSEGGELVAYISSAVTRMLQLVNDLLAYAQATHLEPAAGPASSLAAALEAVVQNLSASIEQTGAVVKAAGSLPEVAAHRAHLVQLLQNLIGNALKYRGDGPPRIEISAERQGSEYIVRVTDNGPGIEPQYADLIFQPFKRLHGPEYPGSGIGLATCNKIVSNYGGRIGVDSVPGKGSSFWFTLPAGDSAGAKAASAV